MAALAKTVRPLFRDEAIRSQSLAVFGRPHTPPSRLLYVLVWLALAALAIGVGVISQLGLTRYARAAGVLQLSNAGATVTARVAGTLTELRVHEGAHVEAGAVLGRIINEHHVGQTQSGANALAHIAAQQQAQLTEKRALLKDLAIKQGATFTQERSQIQSRLRALRLQASLRSGEVTDAERHLERIQGLFSRGFIRISELDNARHQLAERRHVLIGAQSSITDQQGLLRGLETRASEAALQTERQLLDIDIDLSGIAHRQLVEQLSTEQTLVASVSGTVAGLRLQSGTTLIAGQELLRIVPASTRYQAVLMVDDKTARQLQAKAPVVLTVAAYPHEHYGRIQGRLIEVAEIPTAQANVARWRLVVNVSPADGFRLAAGMQVHARLVLERRQVAEWLIGALTRQLRGSH